MIWNGHELVSSGHPEDDDPWCKNCGIPANEPLAKLFCVKAPAEKVRAALDAVMLRCAQSQMVVTNEIFRIIDQATNGKDQHG